MNLILPSLISCDLLNLETTIKQLDPHCAGYHLDIMDFHFVPNLTWGPEFINKIRLATKKPLNIHLMVEYPERYIDLFDLSNNDVISIHLESPSNLDIKNLLEKIKDKKLIPSIAINPETPIFYIKNLLLTHEVKNVLLMAVNPGFSGQKFIFSSFKKLEALNNFKIKNNLAFKIIVDGGVNLNNILKLLDLGANQLAIASAIFKNNNKDYIKSIKEINALISLMDKKY